MKKKKKIVGAFISKSDSKLYEKQHSKLGKIVVKEFIPVDMVEMKLDTDDETFELVADMGLELIKDDKQELFGYAVKRAILDIVKRK
jgi:hypothetical protein